MKHLIVGSSGLLGHAMRLSITSGEIVTIGRESREDHYFDLSDPCKIYSLMEEINPDVVHICAYAAGVDWAEHNPRESFDVNVTGISHVLLAAKEAKAKVTFPSSSYVFAGGRDEEYVENDITFPSNVYGTHKDILERNVRNLFPVKHIIYRTVGLFGYEPVNKKNFVYQIIKAMEEGREMRIPTDQYMNPIFVNNVSSGVLQLLDMNFNGTINMAGDLNLSKFDWAEMIVDRIDPSKRNLFIPVTSDVFPDAAIRPSNACLSTLKYTYFTRKYLSFDLDKFIGTL